jgi:uncharacterized protein (DUF1778 family)
MSEAGKRTVQVNVKMKEEDYELLQAAAEKLWPEAVISNSGILLGLARIAAKQALARNSADNAASSGPKPS